MYDMQETKINTFIPGFFLNKKLLLLNEELIKSIEKKENIFDF